MAGGLAARFVHSGARGSPLLVVQLHIMFAALPALGFAIRSEPSRTRRRSASRRPPGVPAPRPLRRFGEHEVLRGGVERGAPTDVLSMPRELRSRASLDRPSAHVPKLGAEGRSQ